MIINSIDKKNILCISIIRNNGQSFNMEISVKFKNSDTDTDITYSTVSCLYFRDLRYILECYKEISQDKTSFGFTSCDKTINFWVTGTDFIHHLMLRDKRCNYDLASQCSLTFQTQNNLPLLLHDRMNEIQIADEIRDEEIKTDNNDFLSICFPSMVEYVDVDLCVCKIEVDSPYYHIARKFDSSFSEIESLKKKIIDFKSGMLQSFQVLGDFLEIKFLRFNDAVDIQGEISDFTWPHPNEIKFHELVSMNILDKMYLSLEKIWKEMIIKESRGTHRSESPDLL